MNTARNGFRKGHMGRRARRESFPSLRGRATLSGFSLVELMVALVIASLLLVGLTLLYANTNTARIELDKSSRQIESGRYAMAILSDDLRHAGYYGPLINAPTLGVGALPDPCSTNLTVVQNSMALFVQGYDGQATAALLDPGKLGCLTGAAAGYKANTGVLVVRRANTSIAASAPTSGWFNIQPSGCPGDLSAYVLDLDTNPSAFTLHANGAPGCTPITAAPAAKITPYYVRIYFVSTCSATDCSAGGVDSVPTLKRVDITPTGAVITPIVDGIDNLQFDYGIDTTTPGNGSPDVYTNTTAHSATTPTFAEWLNVMAVRIYLLARNSEATGGGFVDSKTYAMGPVGNITTGDHYARHAYTELVRLNNPSGRRE